MNVGCHSRQRQSVDSLSAGPLPFTVLMWLIAAIFVGCSGGTRQQLSFEFKNCNVVLISIDTLRADRMSLYGYSRGTTPRLVDLANESVVFDTFIMNGGFTLPSHISMMTSLTPTVHGIRPSADRALPESRITLAEQLKDAGYATGAFVDAGYLRGHYGFSQGFDVYDDEGGRFATILPKAYEWLDDHHEQPFFLFLHTFDVHSQWARLPYDCPEDFPDTYAKELGIEFSGRKNGKRGTAMLKWVNSQLEGGHNPLSAEELEYISALYDGCINYVDDKVGEVVDYLRRQGIYDQTLIVVTSDHGEEFLDHGRFLHVQRGYEELARVPLLIKMPHSTFGGTRVVALASMIDLMPTVLEVAGIPINRQAQGSSLIPIVTSEEQEMREGIRIWHVLRTHRWKYMPQRSLLFDLKNDPLERNDLFDSRPHVVEALHAEYTAMENRDQAVRETLHRLDGGEEGVPVQLTREQEEELRALGYVR